MRFTLSLLFTLLLGSNSFAAPTKVVASFSILADLVKNIGGDYVSVTTIVGPNEDAHVYQPTPLDSIMISEADLVIINGLGFEGWIERLIKASGFRGTPVIASQGVGSLKARGNPLHKTQSHIDDPHAWHSVPAVMKYVDNISRALAQFDPLHAEVYHKNATAYKQRLRFLDEWIRDEIGRISESKRKVISAHDAFQYFSAEYKVEFLSPVGVSTEAEATPEAIKKLIDLIRKEGIQRIFVENITNERQMHIIQESTGARIGGILYSDALSAAEDPAPDYISLMRHNVALIVEAMRDKES